MELEYRYMSNHLAPKLNDPYRRVVDLWRWSIREVVLYIYK